MANKKFVKPDCWNDDERMNAFFQPFRPRQINTFHYDTKCEFWQDLIYKYCKEKKGDPSFTRKEIQLEFKRKERLPLCLETVIEEMIGQRLIQRKDEVLSNPYNTWATWAVNSFVKSPVKWGLSKVWGNAEENPEEVIYYHILLLSELADDLQNILLEEHPGKVLKLEDLIKIIKPKIHLSKAGLGICLLELYKRQELIVEFEMIKDEIKINLIKVPGKDGTQEELTEYDKNMIKLKETKELLTTQIDELEKQITSYQDLARKCVKEKNPRMAKMHLKRKMAIQNQYDKKSNVLHNVETLINSMEDVQSNGEILSVYKMGSDSLKSLMSKSGLTLENVDEIMSAMKEVSEDNEEIQNTLSNVDATNNTYDDESLEKELKDILGENDAKSPAIVETKKEDTKNKEEIDKDLLELLESLQVETATPNSSTLSLQKLLEG